MCKPVEGRLQPVVDHVVEHLAVPEPVAKPGLRQQVGSVRHRLHAAGDDDVVLAAADHQVGDLDRADRRGAHLVDRVGRDLLRDPRAYRGLPRRCLPRTRLQHLAHDHVADLAGVDGRTLERSADRDRAELRRRQAGETAAQAPEGRSHGADDHGATHGASVPTVTGRVTRCNPTEGLAPKYRWIHSRSRKEA